MTMTRIALIIALLFPVVAFAQPLDAGPSALVDAGSASAPVLPDAGTTPVLDQGSFAWKLYKAGHLVPAIIVALFFVLMFAEKRIAWLRTGYRKVIVSSVLVGLGMLAERVASGTTPNVMMFMGALGAGFTMWMKTHGEPPAPAKA
jgi:hypothetical protein